MYKNKKFNEEKMQIQKETKIGEAVALNFRSAQVFEKFGIDFCCGGKKSIGEASMAKGLDPEDVILALQNIPVNGNGNTANFGLWKPDFLIDYIVNNHHRYVEKMLPVIFTHSQKVAEKHGANHPEVITIAEHFINVKDELEVHMQKEERMLFPYIKRLLELEENGEEFLFPPFGTIENPIHVMELEHEAAGKLMVEINSLSSGYTPPEDACTTYRVMYQELKEFEKDLHVHIHLENNILFPKAIELEKNLTVNKQS